MCKKSILVIFMVFLSQVAFTLEVDEKLTLRIVSTSESKKTVLINRGIEDGLAKGDHAKFFVSSGVVARGVCVKLSPTRSVWSVYRLVNANFLADDQVLKLKITPAVKITKDESKMLVSDDTAATPKDPRDLGIPLAEGADDLKVEDAEKKSQVPMAGFMSYESLLKRNKEIYSLFQFSSLQEKSSPDDNSSEYGTTVTNTYFKVGVEWYFTEEKEWYNRFSFVGLMVIDNRQIMSHLGTELSDETRLFGVGANLHLFDFPSQTYKFIHYLNYSVYIGSSTSSYKSGAEVSVEQSDEVSASVISYQAGYGLKYYANSGFGARLELDYSIGADSFSKSSNTQISYLKNRSGFKVLAGLGYRF